MINQNLKFICLLVIFVQINLVGCSSSPYLPTSKQFERADLHRTEASNSTPNRPKLRKLGNGHYRVTKNWIVKLDGRRWKIQKGYTSNGITAPDLIKRSLGDSIDSPETWAAVFHDWMFTQPGVSRAEADKAFYSIMIAYGVDRNKAQLMYSGVVKYSRSKQSS
jgi:hypothetical protein